MRTTGIYVGGVFQDRQVQAFIPAPLPPADPPLKISPRLQALMEQAGLALGRLDRLIDEFPDINLLIRFYQRKEAVISSQIEGTVSTLTDLLLFERDEKTDSLPEDAQENKNYLDALAYGERHSTELPLSKRLIRELHEILMQGARGESLSPGEFRKIQNAVANSTTGEILHMPPPPQHLDTCMDDLEVFLNTEPDDFPTLLKAALVHVQFETIHPFLDGNGRVGRLLITLILKVDGTLREPILYLSHYFKANRQQYYQLLNNVRITGDWEAWVEFFYRGVMDTATLAVDTAVQIHDLFATDVKRVEALGRTGQQAHRTIQFLKLQPLIKAADIALELKVSLPTALKAVEQLVKLGILRQIDQRERSQLYAYDAYLQILNYGTIPTIGQ